MHKSLMSYRQNSGWMSSNPTLSLFLGWNETHGGSMDRNASSETGQRGEADRRSRVLSVALMSAFVVCVFMLNTVQAFAEPGFVSLGVMKLYSAIDIEHKYDDNVILAEKNRKSSNVTVVTPALSLRLERELSQVELNYGISKGVFYSSRTDDFIDHKIEIKASRQLSKRLSIDASVDYVRSHDPRGVTFTGLAVAVSSPDKWHETTAAFKVGYGLYAHVELTGEYANKRYDNNRIRTFLVDRDSVASSLSFSYPIGVKTLAVVDARYKKYDYKFLSSLGNQDSSEQSYLVGLDWQATAKTEGRFRVGYLLKDFARGNQGRSGNLSLELNMSWMPRTYSIYSLSMLSSTVESNGEGGFIKTKKATFEWKYDWLRRLSHSMHASYIRDNFEGILPIRVDKTLNVGVELEYQLQRWLTFGGGYVYVNKNSDAINASYSQNVFTLNVVGSL